VEGEQFWNDVFQLECVYVIAIFDQRCWLKCSFIGLYLGM
jgi:hypothetical protein